jgi:ubiquinone/menaquinone biosynthesis C-methylase UbiE
MCKDYRNPSIAFFNSIAPKWDSWHDLKSLHMQLSCGLKKFGIIPAEHILDVGCGTGNLTRAVLDQLSERGRVTAIDISNIMIETAKSKITDKRVQWFCEAFEQIDFAEQTFDRIICYSVWPHLTNTQGSAIIFGKWLKPAGKLHIWHTISREKVNKIHSEASTAVQNHLLASAEQTASLLMRSGYAIEDTQDDETGYLVTAIKE